MTSYETVRQEYKPKTIKVLLIAESPPPDADTQSSRHFYRCEKIRRDDRLFVNTIKALYPETADKTEAQLESDKKQWLTRFQKDGYYLIESLETSLPHKITSKERQTLIYKNLPKLVERVKSLVSPATKIVLIKSNVFLVAAEPLRQAGFTVLNTQNVDYPGHFNQRAYRDKLAALLYTGDHGA